MPSPAGPSPGAPVPTPATTRVAEPLLAEPGTTTAVSGGADDAPEPAPWPDDDARTLGPSPEGAEPDPFAAATPSRPPTATETPAAATPTPRRGSVEALATAATGPQLELLRSVFPGKVLRLVPHPAQPGEGDRLPASDDPDADASDSPGSHDRVDPDAPAPGGAA